MSTIFQQDMIYIHDRLSDREIDRLKDSTVLITGCAGTLGLQLVGFLVEYSEELNLSVICLDNFMLGYPKWLKRVGELPKVSVHKFDVVSDDLSKIPGADKADYIFHMAAIASPVFYRTYPLQTIDANTTGFRRILDFYREKNIKGFLFYSSSEIYGEAEVIPTSEDYWGNVSPIGPRSCYDESKRFGETLSYYYAECYNMPIVIVRPFNNYGPGMKINDKRVSPDFASAIINGTDITIYSDGTPTRTYDYIADATIGYLKCCLHGQFDVFNIGSPAPELTVLELAEVYREEGRKLLGYSGIIIYMRHEDRHYLTNNPTRRCPDISKAKRILGFNPEIDLTEGVARYLKYLSENDRSEYEW